MTKIVFLFGVLVLNLLVPFMGLAADYPAVDMCHTSGAPGQTVQLALRLTNAPGYVISAISVDVTYNPTFLESPSARIGPSATAAGKTLLFAQIDTDTIRVGVFGATNVNSIGDGIVAFITFGINPKAPECQTALTNSPTVSDPDGNELTPDAWDGLVVIHSQPLPHYVAPDGLCNSLVPCNKTFDCALACANEGTILKIRGGDYDEDVSMNEPKILTIEGGYDESFSAQTEGSTIYSSTLSQGTIIYDRIVIQRKMEP